MLSGDAAQKREKKKKRGEKGTEKEEKEEREREKREKRLIFNLSSSRLYFTCEFLFQA